MCSPLSNGCIPNMTRLHARSITSAAFAAAAFAAAAAGCATHSSIGLPLLRSSRRLDAYCVCEEQPGAVDDLRLEILDLFLSEVHNLATICDVSAFLISVCDDILEVTCISISTVHASGMGRQLHPGCKKSGFYRYAGTAAPM